MERADFDRDPLELERCYHDAAVERAIAHVQRELLAPELSSSLCPELPSALPDPADERPWSRSNEDAHFARENAAAVREFAETLFLVRELPNLCCRISPSNYHVRDHLMDICRAEVGFARIQNRPIVDIVTFLGPPDFYGHFNPVEPRIGINIWLLLTGDTRSALQAYLHEARHAFQFDVIINPSAHSDIHPATIAKWTQASEHYVPVGPDATPAEIEGYENHVLEIDARDYVERRMKQLDGR